MHVVHEAHAFGCGFAAVSAISEISGAWPWAVDPKIWPGEIPERVPWISGVLAPADAVVMSAPADDPWRANWCKRHGPKFGGCD